MTREGRTIIKTVNKAEDNLKKVICYKACDLIEEVFNRHNEDIVKIVFPDKPLGLVIRKNRAWCQASVDVVIVTSVEYDRTRHLVSIFNIDGELYDSMLLLSVENQLEVFNALARVAEEE